MRKLPLIFMCEYHSQGTLIHVLYVEGRLNSIFILKEIIVSISAKCPVLVWSAFFLNICHGMFFEHLSSDVIT